MDWLEAVLLTFIPVFVAMDGIGTLPIFLSLTTSLGRRQRQAVIGQSILTALLAGLAFVLLGQELFRFLGITVADFKVAGGALLFVLSLNDLLQTTPKQRRKPAATLGVVPLGIPLVVGPAVLTTLIILLDSYGPGPTVVSFGLNLMVVWGLFSLSEWVYKLLGSGGTTALSKVSSVLLAAIGVMMLRKGLTEIVAALMGP